VVWEENHHDIFKRTDKTQALDQARTVPSKEAAGNAEHRELDRQSRGKRAIHGWKLAIVFRLQHLNPAPLILDANRAFAFAAADKVSAFG
jgi:hypothetical protein